ncbi:MULTISPECIES: hypothetical protein [Salipiger]|jgi:hypothetical protein|uniref:Uncharacterized protein n=1 Tax=Salipiger profundus TaxID=1229727 RepID=A0A1U7D883_9RHOB|nr:MULTISPECIES: hypothetical protein [Salipiger]APX24276.1 hypothetical protein Ga0080559_TMP3480 [Salipiger profundus]SFB85406.1 hypothetical protein SAMN05444415_101197 [Salipiger profundus]
MPDDTLEFFDIGAASTTAASFSDNGGYQFALGGETIRGCRRL